MIQGALIFDERTDRYDIRFDCDAAKLIIKNQQKNGEIG